VANASRPFFYISKRVNGVGWHRYIGDEGDVIGIDHFGASAPGPVLMREFGFTAENVCKRARALLERNNV
jgi:transketolase